MGCNGAFCFYCTACNLIIVEHISLTPPFSASIVAMIVNGVPTLTVLVTVLATMVSGVIGGYVGKYLAQFFLWAGSKLGEWWNNDVVSAPAINKPPSNGAPPKISVQPTDGAQPTDDPQPKDGVQPSHNAQPKAHECQELENGFLCILTAYKIITVFYEAK